MLKFTFHIGSIETSPGVTGICFFINLHSTLDLLKLTTVNFTPKIMTDLHSTLDLLKLIFLTGPRGWRRIYIPHWIYWNGFRLTNHLQNKHLHSTLDLLKPATPRPHLPCVTHLHSTLDLLKPYAKAGVEQWYNYLHSTLDLLKRTDTKDSVFINRFTFHIGSIETICLEFQGSWLIHLHSTLDLLKRTSARWCCRGFKNLHSTLDLLKLIDKTQSYAIIKIYIPHWIYWNFSQTPEFPDTLTIYIPHWIYWKVVEVAPVVVFVHLHSTLDLLKRTDNCLVSWRKMDLHSTLDLLKPGAVRLLIEPDQYLHSTLDLLKPFSPECKGHWVFNLHSTLDLLKPTNTEFFFIVKDIYIPHWIYWNDKPYSWC